VFAKTPLVWQGRYNLPLLGGVALCGMLSMRATGPDSPTTRQADAIARFCAAAWVIIEVVAFYQTLRRFMVGETGSLLLRGGWTPPIDAYLLLVTNAATAVAIAWLLLRSTPASSADLGAKVEHLAGVRGERGAQIPTASPSV
jgi:hypothetical protein